MTGKILNKKIAIVGAGLSGITVARELDQHNHVQVFEKSRGMGGRMATRRTETHHFDHGAQFFIARSKEFQDFLEPIHQQNIITPWECNFAEIVDNQINKSWKFSTEYPHFVATPYMNSLCKHLAKDLNILLNTQIKDITFNQKKWSLQTINNQVFNDYDYLILAIPAPQAIALIPKQFKYAELINQISMSGCFTLMLGVNRNLNMQFDAAVVKQSIISWIANNNSKPARPRGFSLVVNSSNKWADANIEEDITIVKDKLLDALKNIIELDDNDIEYSTLHRWKYANAKLQSGEKSLFDSQLNLGLCGDWFISGRVESAFLSGMNLISQLHDR
ncbi:FAD-dependent oxidoreductase [Gammaproteobacteria bacterium]|nr:FAD-dependent oxidoreductase [Gammaproteobacteria bacterium]